MDYDEQDSIRSVEMDSEREISKEDERMSIDEMLNYLAKVTLFDANKLQRNVRTND